jgi:hypothetical protein
MVVDRYVKIVLTVIAVSLMALAAHELAVPAHAQPASGMHCRGTIVSDTSAKTAGYTLDVTCK